MPIKTTSAPDTGTRSSWKDTLEPRRLLHAAWVVPLLLVLLAGVLRFHQLGEPDRIYFDETYYVDDARELLARGVEEGFVVHPSLGKWIIAGGIAVFGDHALGWRAGMALAGTLTVLMTYLVGLRLFRRRGIAALAALLVAVDGLAFTMSRISMLDAALTLFVVTGFWLLLLDRDEQWKLARREAHGPDAHGTDAQARDAADSHDRPPRHRQIYRWLAGVTFGLALATKWSAVLAIGGAGLLVLVSELAFRKRTTGRVLTAWPRIVTSGLLTLVAVPAAIYMLSYAGWFANFELTRPGTTRCAEPGPVCTVGFPTMLADWWGEQQAIAGFHGELDATHGYRAKATTWPAMQRPVAYYYESCSPSRQAELAAEGEQCAVAAGNVAHILGMGNPAIWWLALLAYPLLFFFAFYRLEWPAAAISVLLLAQYLPWLVASRPLFLFYMTPVVPFMALGLAYVTLRLSAAPVETGSAAALGGWPTEPALFWLPRPVGRWLPLAVAVLAVAAFVFWYPILAGSEIPQDAWRLRIWSDRWI
jgi:dolichyl-phosphate-mannose-protein mannosyltransferase